MQCIHCGARFGDRDDLATHIAWFKGSDGRSASAVTNPTLGDFLPDIPPAAGRATASSQAPAAAPDAPMAATLAAASAKGTASSGSTGAEAPAAPARPPPPPLPAGLKELPPKEPKETARTVSKSSKMPPRTTPDALGDFPSLSETKGIPQRKKSLGPAKKVIATSQAEEVEIPGRAELEEEDAVKEEPVPGEESTGIEVKEEEVELESPPKRRFRRKPLNRSGLPLRALVATKARTVAGNQASQKAKSLRDPRELRRRRRLLRHRI